MRSKLLCLVVVACLGLVSSTASAQANGSSSLVTRAPIRLPGEEQFDAGRVLNLEDGPVNFLTAGPEHWTSPEGMAGSIQIMLMLTVLSLAPAVLLMTTCYVRIIIVLGLLRQAIGLQSLPPSQVMTSLALFLTLFVMGPVWARVYNEAVIPYTDPDVELSLEDAFYAGVLPIRQFMQRQIDVAGNDDDVILFHTYMAPDGPPPSTYEEVPLRVLLPAFILSELKTAFLMGFQIYLPFLIVDLVVASVTISMGMLMLPPAVISLPFKLLLFVLVDGWNLVAGMLMKSFGTIALT
ncbi:MAG: flagellar type III secretion system pore protein FliP [Planctomycetota bacterium]